MNLLRKILVICENANRPLRDRPHADLFGGAPVSRLTSLQRLAGEAPAR